MPRARVSTQPHDGCHGVGSASVEVDLQALRTQLEYYLSDDNLQRDRFFHEAISANDGGWLEMNNIMACKRVKTLGASAADVVEALRESDLEVREDGAAVRRMHG